MTVEITEIRIKLMEGSEDRLRAFCSITIDQSFVVRDLKIIDGTNGPFVAMPSRKLTGHCTKCGQKNHLRASFCNQCGSRVPHLSSSGDHAQKLYADVAHPINSECREMIQDAVISEFQHELSRSNQPGYRSRYDDDFDAGEYDEADYTDAPAAAARDGSGFGSGLHDKTPAAKPAPRVDRQVRRVDGEVIARGDQGQTKEAVPKPHFQDGRGGSRGSSVSVTPSDRGGAADQAESGEDDDGFGSGIFD